MAEVDIEKQLTALADLSISKHGDDIEKALPEFLREVEASGLIEEMFLQNYKNLLDLRISGRRLGDLMASGEVKMRSAPWFDDPIAKPFVAVLVTFFTHYVADWQTRH